MFLDRYQRQMAYIFLLNTKQCLTFCVIYFFANLKLCIFLIKYMNRGIILFCHCDSQSIKKINTCYFSLFLKHKSEISTLWFSIFIQMLWHQWDLAI